MTAKFPFEKWFLSKRHVPYRTDTEKQYNGDFDRPPGQQHCLINCSDGGWTEPFKRWLAGYFSTFPSFEKNNHAVYFVHIPKTAGKSIIAALGNSHLVRAHPHFHRTWQDKRNLVAWHACGRLPVAACVRHPIDRAISLYHFFRIHQWPSHEAQHRLIQSKALAADLSTFWETLEIARTARNLRHFKTQSEFLRGAPVVHLLRFENLAEDFRRLAIHLGCPEIQLPHINAALRDSRALTPAAEARIRSFYAEDFDQWYPETS